GQISMSEFATVWSEAEVSRFQGWDANGDGVITPSEAKGGGQPPSSTAATTVASTRTTRNESPPAAEPEPSPAAEATGGDDSPASAAETQPTGASPNVTASIPTHLPEDLLAAARKRIAGLDKNKNGVADRDEWPTTGLLPYPTMDANQDAKVTAEEIAAYQLAIRERNKK
ncbi:MAG: hypothetical protein L0Y71_00155, partial [Gemmataceae bacterium]|nr:hypothetical protein [Gemmataceae bacterium]